MTENRGRWITLFAVVAGVIGLDQLSKRWIIENVRLGELREPIAFLNDYFRLTYSENTGFAFGMGQGGGNIIMLIAIGAVIGMLYYYPRIQPEAFFTRIGMGMVMGGALGNVIDRLEYGFVVDFINYRIPSVISNVSNIADHAIVIGVFVILFDNWRLERLEKQAQIEATEGDLQTEALITEPESQTDV